MCPINYTNSHHSFFITPFLGSAYYCLTSLLAFNDSTHTQITVLSFYFHQSTNLHLTHLVNLSLIAAKMWHDYYPHDHAVIIDLVCVFASIYFLRLHLAKLLYSRLRCQRSPSIPLSASSMDYHNFE